MNSSKPALSLIFIFALFIICGNLLPAQQKLYLNNPNSLKRIELTNQTSIKFKLSGDKYWHKDSVAGCTEKHLLTGAGDYVLLDSIALVKAPHPNKAFGVLRRIGGSLVWLGPLFGTIDVVNRGVTGARPVVDGKTMIISGSISAVGGALLLFPSKKKIKPGEKWQFQVLDE